MTPDGRTLHYGQFYGVEPIHVDDRPQVVVWGNCQAEALRLLLASVNPPWRTVRVPPVHELTADDLPHVRALLTQTDVLVSQPVRAGYRDLPIGTEDAVGMARSALTLVRWPVLRYSGLYPFQVIVRDPDDPSADPPGVPYHDLRTIAAARDGRPIGEDWQVDVAPDAVRAAAQRSIDELRRREQRDADVAVSDAFVDAGTAAAHTINHPGNPVLATLARRILDVFDIAGTPSADHDLLGDVRAPMERNVLEALGIEAQARHDWIIGDRTAAPRDIAEQQLRWYAERPRVVDAALERHGELLDLLGMSR